MANTPAERAQAEYLERLRVLLRRAPDSIREDALREVQTHIEDEWQALGGDDAAMQQVLSRLGPPDAYGRDLALQLMLLRGRKSPSPLQLLQAAVFWAGTSLLGSLLVISAALFIGFALGMLVTAVERLRGIPMMLIDARQFQVGSYQAEQIQFPSLGWSPLLIAMAGLLPAMIAYIVLYRFLSLWVRSRLAARGLQLVTGRAEAALPAGWERRAVLAMAGFAVVGLTNCLIFSIISQLIPIGREGTVSLPEDFFRTPLTALAFINGLVFLCAPILGLLWTARRGRPIDRRPQDLPR